MMELGQEDPCKVPILGKEGDEVEDMISSKRVQIHENPSNEPSQIHEVNHENAQVGSKFNPLFQLDPLEMWEVIEQILFCLGLNDLESCGKVCTRWRSEFQRRKCAFVDVRISSEKGLKTVIQKLRLRSPKTEIKALDLTWCPPCLMASQDFLDFINYLTPVLGTLEIHYYPGQVGVSAIHKILKWCPNIFRLYVHRRYIFQEDHVNHATAQLFPIPVLNDQGQQIGEHTLQSVRTIHYNTYLHPVCTIPSIIRACPNLTELEIDSFVFDITFQEEALDFEAMEQLKLDSFRLVSLTLPESKLIESFQKFLKVQAPNLKKLAFTNELSWFSFDPDPKSICPIPVIFPSLTQLRIDKILTSRVAKVLEYTPALQKLELALDNSKSGGWFMTKERPLPIRDQVIDLRVTYVQPRDISRFGHSFQNLKRLTLCGFTKGVLQVVYKELAQLEVLSIDDTFQPLQLQNYDFTGIRSSADIRTVWRQTIAKLGFGGGQIREPYIGNLTNLKELTLLVVLGRTEITDEIFTHGIFDIIANLNVLTIIEVEKSWFSDDSIRKLECFMDRAPIKPFDGYIDYEYRLFTLWQELKEQFYHHPL